MDSTVPARDTNHTLPAGLRRLDRRDFFRLAASALLLAALPGCGGTSGDSSGGTGNSGPLTGTVPIVSAAGTLNTAQLGGAGLTVGSTYQQSATPDGSGKFTTTVSAQGAQLLTVTDGAGQTRGLGTSVPGSPLTLDATSTALTLLYMTPGVVSIDLKEAASRLATLQALPSFAALTAFLAKNLPTTSLSALAKGGQLMPLKQACITAYLTAHPAAVRPAPVRTAHQTNFTDDPLSEVLVTAGIKSTDGTPLNFNNSGWRYVSVYRQFLDATGSELAPPYKEANLQGTFNATGDPGLLSGANALSLGSLFTGQVGSAGSGTEKLDLSLPAGLAKVRYWIIGPGLGPIPNPLPFSIPESVLSTQSYGATVFYYSFLPLADFVIGAATSLLKGLQAMAVLWAGLSKGINTTNLVVAFQSGSPGNVSLALVDAIAAMAIAGVTVYTALGLGGVAATAAAAVLTGLALLFDGANAAVALANFLLHPRESAVTFEVQAAAKYTLTDLTPLISGSQGSEAHAINNKGQVAGYFTRDSPLNAFLYDGSKVIEIGNGTPHEIVLNDTGQVVGQVETTTGVYFPFLYSNGQYKVLNIGNGFGTPVSGINDSGQIVGAAPFDANSIFVHGFLYSGNALTHLDPPDGGQFLPAGINNSGQIIGTHYTIQQKNLISKICLYSNGQFTDLVTLPSDGKAVAINASGQFIYNDHASAFLSTNGVSTPLTFPGATAIYPTALNASGQVVGFYSANNGGGTFLSGAFLYSGGKMMDLLPLLPAGITNFTPTGINDAGQICGTAFIGVNHAILLTPV